MARISTVLMLVLCLVVFSGCAGFNCSIGVGYRKIPPTMPHPIIAPEVIAARAEAMGASPALIDLLLKFLASPNFAVMFPKGERTDLGGWVEIQVR